jgi:hypothetical protein
MGRVEWRHMIKNIEDDRRIEEVFLAYANYNTRDKIENVYAIIKVIDKTFCVREDKSKLREFVDKFIKKQNRALYSTKNILEEAIDLKKCKLCGINYGKSLLCLRCWQLGFISMLKEIVNGKEYSKIKDFDASLRIHENHNIASNKIYAVISKSSDNSEERVVLKKANYTALLFFVPDIYSFFNETLQIACYCLVEFLTQDERNRERIKICTDCNNFFVTSKFDQRIKKCPECSPKSKKSKEYNREYAKRYRKVLKEKKTAREKELAIKKYMEKAKITRREAERIWDLDHES